MDTIHIINLQHLMLKQSELKEHMGLPSAPTHPAKEPGQGQAVGVESSLESVHADGGGHSLVKVSPGISQLSKLVECIQAVQMLVNGLDFSRQIQKKKEKYDYMGLTIGDALKGTL